jgi:hypothetical protein
MMNHAHRFLPGSFGILLLAAVAGAAAPTPDRSRPVADYVRIGMPDPGQLWTASDYRDCRRVLLELDRTNRAALPRIDSAVSGPVFARLVNPTNTQLVALRGELQSISAGTSGR